MYSISSFKSPAVEAIWEGCSRTPPKAHYLPSHGLLSRWMILGMNSLLWSRTQIQSGSEWWPPFCYAILAPSWITILSKTANCGIPLYEVFVRDNPEPNPQTINYFYCFWLPTKTKWLDPIAEDTHTLVVGYRETRLELSREFPLSESVMQAPEAESHPWSYLSMIPVSHNDMPHKPPYLSQSLTF